jgi:CelD/BcsL family acetyltransferase involved in cellulose biosynthesis
MSTPVQPAERPVTESARTPYRVRIVSPGEVDSATARSWEALEERALEPNAFLSPHFVIPAVRHLGCRESGADPRCVFVEKAGAGAGEMVGAGVFVPHRPIRWFPMRHLQAFHSPHSYLSGLLLDRSDAEGAARALLHALPSVAPSSHGVVLEDCSTDGAQWDVLAGVARESGARWQEEGRSGRAVFVPSAGGPGYIDAHFSRRQAKNARRLRRRLEERGRVGWRAVFGRDVDDACVERFLQLEHMGWKRARGSSLRSLPAHETFFREMVEGFRGSGRVFFTELLVDDRVIASTANLISGNAGFAFKIGWHSDYAAQAPGLLNEVEFIQAAPAVCGHLAYIDSGAGEGSFIEEMWARRRILSSGVYATTALGRTAAIAIGALTAVVRRVRSIGRRRLAEEPDST